MWTILLSATSAVNMASIAESNTRHIQTRNACVPKNIVEIRLPCQISTSSFLRNSREFILGRCSCHREQLHPCRFAVFGHGTLALPRRSGDSACRVPQMGVHGFRRWRNRLQGWRARLPGWRTRLSGWRSCSVFPNN